MRRTLTRSLLRITLSMLVLASPAGAGVIRGDLWLTRRAAELARAARNAPSPVNSERDRRAKPVPVSMKPPVPAPRADAPRPPQRGIDDAVVYIERVPDKVEHKLAPKRSAHHRPPMPRMVQSNQAYVPRVLVATVGDSVEFENLDRVYHNTFSVSAAKRFDLHKYPPGHRDVVAFERVGVANLHCDIHPDEIGFVVVVPNHVVARPDSTGRFQLPKLPAGDYTLRVWHPRLGEIKRQVTMAKKGDVQVELVY
jgi:plastocyanin